MTCESRGVGWYLALVLALAWGCAPGSEPPPSGMVSAATPEATQAGLEILAAGGNAVDAAVTVSLALGVTEPAGSGLGGQTVMLVYRPGRRAEVLDGSSVAPAATPPDANPDDLTGYRLTTVPTTVKTLDRALELYGSGRITWAEVLAPAIRYAEDGYPLTGFRHRALTRYRGAIAASPSAARLLLEGGAVPAPGTLHRQAELARTLHRLAEAGAEDFYTGEIASAIARDMAANDGWLTAADLAAAPEPRRVAALSVAYRGHRVFTAPPPYGGWVVLAALTALEQAPPSGLAEPGPARTLWLAESLRYAHGTRMRDPVPDLADWRSAVDDRIDADRAARHMERASPADALDRGETTHFSVLDASGMAVAVTQSVNSYYGAKVASPELGFPYNSYMLEFETGAPDHPFALGPGARPLSSMSPTVVVGDRGRAELVLGSPGSARIISSIVQVISSVLDQGMAVDEAVAEARLHVIPAEAGADILYLEGLDPVFDADTDETGITRAVGPGRSADPVATGGEAGPAAGPADAVAWWGGPETLELARVAGFAVNGRDSGLNPPAAPGALRLDTYFGGVHAVAFGDGLVSGAADPRRDGVAATDDVVLVPQESGTTAQLRGLSAASDSAAWATGANGAFTRTADGGATWRAGAIPGADSLFLVDVHAVSADTAVVLGTHFEGGLARIYRTDDGGESWRIVHEDARDGAFYDGLACWDPRRCVAFGDPVDGGLTVVRTEDGETWTASAVPVAPGEAGFAASGTAIAVAGMRHAWIGTGGGTAARVFRTDDGGESWTAVETPLPAGATAGLFGIALTDTLNGLAVGGDYAMADDPAANLLHTADGGRSWELLGRTTPPGVKWGLAVGHVDQDDIWLAVSPAGAGYSLDAGATWTRLADGRYNTVAFAGPAGWVAGAGGRIARVTLRR